MVATPTAELTLEIPADGRFFMPENEALVATRAEIESVAKELGKRCLTPNGRKHREAELALQCSIFASQLGEICNDGSGVLWIDIPDDFRLERYSRTHLLEADYRRTDSWAVGILFGISVESITATNVLPMLGSNNSAADPRMSLRIQSAKDSVFVGGANGKGVEAPKLGSWHPFPLAKVQMAYTE